MPILLIYPHKLVGKVLQKVMPVSHDLGFIFIFLSIAVHCSVQIFTRVSKNIFTPSLSSFNHIFSGTAGAGISQEDTKLKSSGPGKSSFVTSLSRLVGVYLGAFINLAFPHYCCCPASPI